MKTLILLRHAKSSWDDPALLDHDRPLNKRGNRDAPRMALRLLPYLPHIDAVWVSSAVRTQATWALLEPVLAANTPSAKPLTVLSEPGLYDATLQQLLSLVQHAGGSSKGLLLVHHQPGISDLTAHLTGDAAPAFPTCAFGVLQCRISTWRALAPGCATLLAYDYPKRAVDTL